MSIQPLPPHPAPEVVCFDRREFGVLFSLYGRMVAAGEWRDYALTTAKDVAIFAIFRRAAEVPLYRVEKRPELRQRQGIFAVLGQDGRVLRRGHDLAQVLRVLEKVRVIE
jgi:hypothetical protein